jgi:delta-1-pyrroline-5-carboxylate synthetase
MLRATFRSPVNNAAVPSPNGKVAYNSACAAAGQLELMSLYETMFSQWDIPTSQMLVTAFDFTSAERCVSALVEVIGNEHFSYCRRANIQYVLTQLLALGIVPIVNENDAVFAATICAMCCQLIC